ncbi:N-acetylmuramoyl-L-alanine amidase [Bacillus cereus]|uniref:N-acetylmuramoyl-L-alanine amidase n=1 Tax=Bacillus cereus TaxID=1396 RepID=UPI003D168262
MKNIKVYKKAIALSVGITALSSPLVSFAQVNNQARPTIQSTTPIDKGSINGVSFKEWIVPAGNDNIRPQIPMSPKFITIHETANKGVGAGARSHAEYLHKQAIGATDRQASWHYTVDDKEIYQHIPINEVSWNAGDGRGAGNIQSIAIEIAVNPDSNYTVAVENAKKLVGYLLNQTGISPSNVVRHQDWTHKDCPAKMNSLGLWDSFVSGAKGYANGGGNNVSTQAQTGKQIQINGSVVRVRQGMGTNYPISRYISRGQKLPVLEEKNGWIRVGNGQWVFFDSNYISYV